MPQAPCGDRPLNFSMDGGGSVSLVVFDREKGVPVMLNRHPSKKVRANAISLGVIFGN